MPDVTPAPAGSPTPSPVGNTNGESPTPKGSETAEKLLGIVEKMQTRLDSQSAIINRMEDALKKGGKPETPPANTPAPEADLVARVKALEASEKDLKDRDAKVKKSAAIQAISSKLREQGNDANTAPRFAQLIYGENAQNIQVVEKDDGTLAASIKDGDKVTDLNVWLDAYLQTDSGRAFAPTVRNPSLPRGNLTPSTTGKLTISKAQVTAGKFDLAIMAKGGYNVVD